MPPSDAEDSSSSCGSSICDDDGCSDIDKLSKEDEENDEAGSQVTLSTMGTYASVDFLTPDGLISFSAALPAKHEKLVLKNLPKSINISTLTKKNYRVVVKTLVRIYDLATWLRAYLSMLTLNWCADLKTMKVFREKL
jgi:hypothetical protein